MDQVKSVAKVNVAVVCGGGGGKDKKKPDRHKAKLGKDSTTLII